MDPSSLNYCTALMPDGMKLTSFSILLTLFTFSILYLPSSFAQDYTQWNLPEGAKARLGSEKTS